MASETVAWKPEIGSRDKPAYLAIADAIASDVAIGRLMPGHRLPPQRTLAEHLGLDLTTVTRAYNEARHRGLVEARVGQGTFVRAPVSTRFEDKASASELRLVDMGMNQPPLPANPKIIESLRQGLIALAESLQPHDFLRYPDARETLENQSAGAAWLHQRLPDVSSERIVTCPGTQSALLALLTILARPGDTVCAETLTYPGFKAVAAQLGLRVIGIPMDADGLDPGAVRAIFSEHQPKALYCIPTLQNPTTASLTLERRCQIARLAREYAVPILEDDIYGPLAAQTPPPLAVFAPENVYYIGSLAKCLSPILRIAYVMAPDTRQAWRLGAALRSTALIASPLTAAVARRWIFDGTAHLALDAIREEAVARNRLATEILPSGSFIGKRDAFHMWLPLPEGWNRVNFAACIRARGIAAATSDLFAVGHNTPEALRICLGAPIDRAETRHVLEILAETLGQFPSGPSVII